MLYLIAWMLLIIFGIVKLFSPDEKQRKTGKLMLMIGVLLPLVILLIGFAVCTLVSH